MQLQPKPAPMTNAERQQRWRETHRPAERQVQYNAPQLPPQPALPPAPQATPPELMGPETLFETYIRKMPPARKLYLAMLIMDDLNALCGKRKARRNQQYVVQSLGYASELAALPQPMLAEEPVDAPALEQHIDPPLLAE